MQSHTMRAYDEELRFLAVRLATMGGQAERMIDRAVSALVRGDIDLARRVVEEDALLDAAQREVDDKAVLIIARRQPMAGDLREVIGAMRIAADLERIGDLAKNIAKRVPATADSRLPASLLRGLESLAELGLAQVKEVLDIHATRAVERLSVMRDRDEEIDAIYTSVFRDMLATMMADPRNITPGTHLLFCAKNIERIGDHATNIAETIYFTVTGGQLPADRPKEDKSHRVALAPSTETSDALPPGSGGL